MKKPHISAPEPCFYDLLMYPLERMGLRRLRRKIFQNIHGRVLELGAGSGLNIPVYPTTSDFEIIALEPSFAKTRCAHSRRFSSAHSGDKLTWVMGKGETLPFADNSFDAVVATLVLCSVQSLDGTLSELKRVLKPDGELRFLEHVRPTPPVLGKIFDILTPAWYAVAEGCYLNRESGQAIKAAGFQITENRSYLAGIVQIFFARSADLE